MKVPLATALLLLCAACSQQDAPSDQIVETAEDVVDPAAAEALPLAKGRFAPRDDCAEVEGANPFRRELAAAVEARDADRLAALAANDIKLDFGDGGGVAELRKRLADPSWDLWDELGELMALGCATNEQGGIAIPWYFEQDLSEADPASGMLVTGEDVPVLEAPDPASRRLAAVSWDVVEIASLEPDKPYQRVETGDKVVGFVPTGKLRSLLDYRLIASSRNGKWSVTSLVAGD